MASLEVGRRGLTRLGAFSSVFREKKWKRKSCSRRQKTQNKEEEETKGSLKSSAVDLARINWRDALSWKAVMGGLRRPIQISRGTISNSAQSHAVQPRNLSQDLGLALLLLHGPIPPPNQCRNAQDRLSPSTRTQYHCSLPPPSNSQGRAVPARALPALKPVPHRIHQLVVDPGQGLRGRPELLHHHGCLAAGVGSALLLNTHVLQITMRASM